MTNLVQQSRIIARPPRPSLESLNRRIDALVAARPEYGTLVRFYGDVFRLQIEWRPRVVVHPEKVDPQAAHACLGEGTALIDLFAPGLELASLLGLWREMKALFGAGNTTLAKAMKAIDEAEADGRFEPGAFLAELRPGHADAGEAARTIGVDVDLLISLARAVTLPHWQAVAWAWFPDGYQSKWPRSRCPVCCAPPALGELRVDPRRQDEGDKIAPERKLNCGFCGTAWIGPSMACLACDSVRAGDARYFFWREEPGLRIDYCNSCKSYLRVVDGARIAGPLHVGLEALCTTHLDTIASREGLVPLGDSKHVRRQ